MATRAPDHRLQSTPGSPPHHVIARVGALERAVALIAAVEGRARLIETIPLRDAADGDLLGAVQALRQRTGFPLPADSGAIDGIIVDACPLAVLLIGERDAQDAAALATVRNVGAVSYLSIPSAPPARPQRDATWTQPVLAAWHAGSVDVICAVLPVGPFPVWAAQLFNALGTVALDRPPPLLVVTAEGEDAILPWFARGLVRGPTLEERFATALAAVAGDACLPGLPELPPCTFRSHALLTSVIAAHSVLSGAVCYCDIGTGTTLITADDSGVHVSHDPLHDCGMGAVTLLADDRQGEIARWLPAGLPPDSARAWALRRAAAPDALLTDPTDRAIAAAFARAALAAALRGHATGAAGFDTLILGAGWLRWSTPEEMLRVALDTFAPSRPINVSLDHDDLLAVAGFLARERPESAESIFTHDALHALGTLIVHTAPQRNRQAEPVTLITSDGAMPTTVAPQSVTRVAVDMPTPCELSGGQPSHAFVAPASEFGLLIDTRARPLTPQSAGVVAYTSVSDRLRAPS